MQVNKIVLQATAKQIKAYFTNREKLPTQANSNEECSKFSANDVILTTLCNEMSNKVTENKLPSFGTSMFKFNNNSTLLKKCCDCPNNPNPFRTRNAARNAAESALKAWLLNAEKYSNEGGEIEDEQTQIINVGRDGKMPIKYIK
jgi:hypothetical protein